MPTSTGVKLCSSLDEAIGYGDGYLVRPVPGTTDCWVAIPKHPGDRLAVDKALATWSVGTPPMARASDPGTSHDAAAVAALAALPNRLLCLHAHVYAGATGLTGSELENATGRPYESIGPRRPSLEKDGLIRKATTADGHLRRRGGKQVYVATAAGITYYQQHRNAA